MAERPVFIPSLTGSCLVHEKPVRFTWHSGMAATQKRKNVRELHAAARAEGLHPLLEISTKSEDPIGVELSAFNLMTSIDGRLTTVECTYQGSKVFEGGGPFNDLYFVDSRAAKTDERLRNSGRIMGFELEETIYPLSPPTAFYDWIYINALHRNPGWQRMLGRYAGFTDIEFNPERSLNCQARSCATYVSLVQRALIDDALESFAFFAEMTYEAVI